MNNIIVGKAIIGKKIIIFNSIMSLIFIILIAIVLYKGEFYISDPGIFLMVLIITCFLLPFLINTIGYSLKKRTIH